MYEIHSGGTILCSLNSLWIKTIQCCGMNFGLLSQRDRIIHILSFFLKFQSILRSTTKCVGPNVGTFNATLV